jgi:hypothetical protein
LNLDSDVELAAGPRYAPPEAVRAAMEPHVAWLAARLLEPGDVLVTESSPPGVANGLPGRAYCPTLRAISLLERAGAHPVSHPTQDVLRTVNSRAFCASLGQTLPGAAFAVDIATAIAVLAAPPPLARDWRLKRAFGMAGRGQRKVSPGAISEANRRFLEASIAREEGIQIEPNVAIVRELGIHGLVDRDGSTRVGRLVEQQCDEHGQWKGTSIAADVDAVTAETMADEARRVGRALFDAGYWGPFGIDAFVYRDSSGALALQPRSEINARYSMGFVVGFGRD